MKRRRPSPAEIALARKRALIRRLMEQSGLASVAPETTPATERNVPLPSNIVQFPIPGK